jgi:hypothetical protein
MPKLDRKSLLTTRLAETDIVRFRELALSQKVSYSELLREATLFYLDHYEQAKKSRLESVYAQQRKADTNRICAMLSKVGVEVRTIIEFLKRMEGGPELVQDCMSIAAKRLDKGFEKEAERIKTQMQEVIES